MAAVPALELPRPTGTEQSLFTDEMKAELQRRMAIWQRIDTHVREIRIAACVFARNDRQDMEHWLKNAAVYADERIVLDTGSTDGTRECAERAGAKVYDFLCRTTSLPRAMPCWHMRMRIGPPCSMWMRVFLTHPNCALI